MHAGRNDKLLKRLELYFDDQQADLALFSAVLKVTFLLREDTLTELEASLLKAQVVAARDRPLANLPVVKDAAEVATSPADTPDILPAMVQAFDEDRLE